MIASPRLMEEKRSRGGGDNDTPPPPGRDNQSAKRAKHSHMERNVVDDIEHALLPQYYREIRTLRAYALSKLPASSRIRRRKIASVGLSSSTFGTACSEVELDLGHLLDTTLVAGSNGHVGHKPDHRWEQFLSFSQKGDDSYVTLSDGQREPVCSQSEIVDFVIWLLFSREKSTSWPKHLLCSGFRRHRGANPQLGSDIAGVFSAHPNHRVKALKEPPWPQLLMLLGKAGERVMMDLLIDCAIFVAVKAGKGNLYQLSGTPIADLEPLTEQPANKAFASHVPKPVELRPSEISFVRSRMMYARAALNARGLVHFGLRHIHVLNRFQYKPTLKNETELANESLASGGGKDDTHHVHVMMYIFPRQFGLHNVFTSVVDRKQTAQKFQDYTLREEEIAKKFPKKDEHDRPVVHIPKRLKGRPERLVQQLQVLHGRCSYAEMLQHYCPAPGDIGVERKAQSNPEKSSLPPSSRAPSKHAKLRRKSRHSLAAVNTPAPGVQFKSITDLATPLGNVSAFCQAVLSKIVPNGFWGRDGAQEHNKQNFLRVVNCFIHLRRFESLCLHEVMQGMKTKEIDWLIPPGLANQKSSQTDSRKRTEIFYEFLYYIFDSLLIPLIRSNFYVTESSVHRYRVFFFRHDVWRYVAEPAMASLKSKMFEEVSLDDSRRILESRKLGFAQVRLLPKQLAMRPIMNLRRRTMIRRTQKILGPSINSILNPVSSVLKYERMRNPGRLGAAMFSVGDIYNRLKAFKAEIGEGEHQFYFAKVDVQAAFDTIPQDAMIEILRGIPKAARYSIANHVEIRTSENPSGGALASSKTTKRWHSMAKAEGDKTIFLETLEKTIAASRKNTIFADNANQKTHSTRDLLALTATHIEQNLVRIGKKYYRQKSGIPQGSVLSSTLCNYFYADLERQHLDFLLEAEDCLLLRLIDDFLLITTDKSKARRFVETMHRGLPEYGVSVSLGKSLANFHLVVKDGCEVPRSNAGRGFPYCGLEIDCKTLDVAKQRDNTKDPVIFNSLTVDFSRCPGRNFKRKVINAFKIQSHLMFFDTSHNSRQAVLANAYTAFVETATKMWAHARCLGHLAAATSRPSPRLLIDTIKSLIDVAFLLLTSKSRKLRYPGYSCTVTKTQLAWLAMVACRQVLVRKQTGYREVVSWLEEETRKLLGQKGLDCPALVNAVKSISSSSSNRP